METIEKKAKEYIKYNGGSSPLMQYFAYVQGAKDILHDLMMTMSVSEDGHLENNLKILIKSLKGKLNFNDVGIIDDREIEF